jgi:hypothetical protein
MVIYSMLDAVLVSAVLGRDPGITRLIIPHGSLLETGSSSSGRCSPETRYNTTIAAAYLPFARKRSI